MQGHTERIELSDDGGESTQTGPAAVGKYEIVEQIGEGGFGVVYKGFDPFIKRHVAIKTCTSSDQELRDRYFREAQIAGQLDHPNVVRIFDFGTEDDTPYLVQEFLAGTDLDRKIEGHDFVPYPERLLYLIHIARGLRYAHQQGVIHRDIKPANIRILEDGSAKIMDFGVAMLQQTDTRLTQDGMAVGTAAYLAPEQVQGKSPDHRTDIFSYGVLAYELITGERPFERDSISATLFSIVHDDPKPITMPTRVCPEGLRRLIERCMEKSADDRYADFSEILEDLNSIRREMRPMDSERDFASELRQVARSASRANADAGVDRQAAVVAEPRQRFDPPIRHEWTPTSIRLQRRRRWTKGVLPLAVLALLLAAYAGLAQQGWLPWWEEPTAVPTPIPELSRLGPAQPGADLQDAIAADEETPITSSLVEEGPDDAPAAGSIVTAESEVDQEAAPEPPPPPPAEATLYLQRGWHDAMTVSVDGDAPVRLSRGRSRTLAPGDHTLVFSLVTPDYRSSETIRVRLGSGEERTVKSPIGRPGQLSVQASLGSPQGAVSLDGSMVGSSPLRGYQLSPGRHRLRVFALDSPTVPLIDTVVEIRSSRETVITFDLTGQRELAIRYRSAVD